MFKKLYIPLIIFLAVLIATAAYMLYPKTPPLRVVATSPTGGASLNPFLPVVITFNQTVNQNEVAITIGPTTAVNITASGKSIQITPQTKFNPNTQYNINVGTNPPYALTFTTESSVENAPGWNQLMNQAFQQYEQQNATQDAALKSIRTHVPLQEGGFTINYSYANNTYTITLSPPYDQNKESFLNWLNQSGVTNLTNLRLNYINQ